MLESSGLMESLKRLMCTLLAIFRTRLELLSNEVEEELVRIGLILLYGFIGLFFAGLTIVMVVVFIVAAFWDSYRLEVLGGLTAIFFLGGVLAWFAVRRAVREKSRLFSCSLAELSNDGDRLAPRP